MLKVAIIGGKLQGTEAAYLAKKAGFKSILIDKKKNTPASGICDVFEHFDVCKKERELIDILRNADFILPALENHEVHHALAEIAEKHHIKLAYDLPAYKITSSKLKSDKLIRENNIPAPCYYPECKSPYIIKPSDESGSLGVKKIESSQEVDLFLNFQGAKFNWVVQEFLDGPSYSIEVIGRPGNYRVFQITQIHMDEVYDCKMVTSPCSITNKQKNQLEKIAFKLAALVNLHGIMDVEVIDDEGTFKVLEIDARIPSQTPTVVYHASGINLLAELAEITLKGNFSSKRTNLNRYCAYEHYLVNKNGVFPHGEHIMSQSRPLSYRENFFGADEVLSDYDENHENWCGTFINWADSAEELEGKRENMINELIKQKK